MDRRQPDGFLPAMPARYRVRFEHPKLAQRGGTGVIFTRTGSVGFWAGSWKLPPQLPLSRLMRNDVGGYLSGDGTPMHLRIEEAKKVLEFIRSRDSNEGFFFADIITIPEGSRVIAESNNLPVPVWHNFILTTDPNDPRSLRKIRNAISIPNADATDIDSGDIISFRKTGGVPGLQNFVTARLVASKNVGSTNTELKLDYALPSEFTENNTSITNQYCYNRPHVRAVFLRNASSWQVGHGFIDIDAVEWAEDSIRNVSAFIENNTSYLFALDHGNNVDDSSDDTLYLLEENSNQYFYDLS